MLLTLARWCCLATLFLPLAALHSQTTAARSETTSTKQQGSWKLMYQENFEEANPIFPQAPLWALDSFQNTDKWADGGSFFRQAGDHAACGVSYRGAVRHRRLAQRGCL